MIWCDFCDNDVDEDHISECPICHGLLHRNDKEDRCEDCDFAFVNLEDYYGVL